MAFSSFLTEDREVSSTTTPRKERRDFIRKSPVGFGECILKQEARYKSPAGCSKNGEIGDATTITASLGCLSCLFVPKEMCLQFALKYLDMRLAGVA